jgi:hypothetical protein
MSRRQPRQGGWLVGSRRRRAVSWLVSLFQVFAIVTSFQLSSVGHFAGDLVQMVTEGHHHHDGADQDEDDPGHECPPGCPNCHHVHLSGAAFQPAPASSLAPTPPGEASTTREFADDGVPAGPQLPSIYRPPRA